MIACAYTEFCEQLWFDWLANRLQDSRLDHTFQLTHAPEPYLRFDEGTNPLCLLFTNPGIGLQHQVRQNILDNKSCIRPDLTYHDNAARLGAFYRADLPSGAARTRNNAIQNLTRLLHHDCVVQFETLPFHSSSLPSKSKLPALSRQVPVLASYAAHLAEALKLVSVLALSATATNCPITLGALRASPWLAWQAKLMGMSFDALHFLPLVQKHGRATSVLIYDRQPHRTAAFVLTMGGNTFPALPGLRLIAQALTLAPSSLHAQSRRCT